MNIDRTISPKLILTIENTKGNIFTSEDEFINGCTTKENINKIKASSLIVRLGQEDLTCISGNNGYLFFDKNKIKIICESKNPIKDNPQGFYDTTLYVELKYGYFETVKKEIDIKKENI